MGYMNDTMWDSDNHQGEIWVLKHRVTLLEQLVHELITKVEEMGKETHE
jgi:hypothetical protein